MAIKQKSNEQRGKLMDILTTEYRFESLLLAILTIVTASVGVLILDGTLAITNFPIISQSPNNIIFAWAVIIISILGLSLVVYPFFLPAIPELKRITWATRKKLVDYTIRVLIFTTILTIIILTYDIIIVNIIRMVSER